MKDARDIANILKHYFELQSDLVYENHSDLFIGEEDLSLEEISSIVIGREIKLICKSNLDLYNRVQSILEQQIKKMETSAFIVHMVAENNETIETNLVLLEKMNVAIKTWNRM
jgi:predicted nucleotidyltransferase